jgi:hypothetical protein
MEHYGRAVGRLRQQGEEKSEEYKALLEHYMRHSCSLMCEKYERVARSSLVEMKGIVMLSKVIPDVLLHEVYCEVLSACVDLPVAIAQSHLQVFMHEVPSNLVGEVGLGGECWVCCGQGISTARFCFCRWIQLGLKSGKTVHIIWITVEICRRR